MRTRYPRGMKQTLGNLIESPVLWLVLAFLVLPLVVKLIYG